MRFFSGLVPVDLFNTTSCFLEEGQCFVEQEALKYYDPSFLHEISTVEQLNAVLCALASVTMFSEKVYMVGELNEPLFVTFISSLSIHSSLFIAI